MLELNESRSYELLLRGHLLATDIANDLVNQGVSFREAYNLVANMVSDAEAKSEQIGCNEKTFEMAVEARSNLGGTSRERVLECIYFLRDSLRGLNK